MREDRASPSARIISLLVVTIGIASLISSILIHPSVSRYWRADILNYQDVSLQYAVWSAVLGVVVLTVGFTFFKANSSRMGHVVTLFTTLSIIVLSDRLLLATYGLPLWIPDAENHYVHRPNVIRSWGKEFEDKLIRINSYGHHDDEFPIKKARVNLGIHPRGLDCYGSRSHL
jgi:multidrug transporter EmrE-like cation transporter